MNIDAPPQRLPKRILSVHQAARRLNVGRRVIEKMIDRGKLVPDYITAVGSFFDVDRLSDLDAAIIDNRLRNRTPIL